MRGDDAAASALSSSRRPAALDWSPTRPSPAPSPPRRRPCAGHLCAAPPRGGQQRRRHLHRLLDAHLQQRRLRARDVRQRHPLPRALCGRCGGGGLPCPLPLILPCRHAPMGGCGCIAPLAAPNRTACMPPPPFPCRCRRRRGRLAATAVPGAHTGWAYPASSAGRWPGALGVGRVVVGGGGGRVSVCVWVIMSACCWASEGGVRGDDGGMHASLKLRRPPSHLPPSHLPPAPCPPPAPPQVCVDMGEPILRGADVPTTLQPTQVRGAGGGGSREPAGGGGRHGASLLLAL